MDGTAFGNLVSTWVTSEVKLGKSEWSKVRCEPVLEARRPVACVRMEPKSRATSMAVTGVFEACVGSMQHASVMVANWGKDVRSQ